MSRFLKMKRIVLPLLLAILLLVVYQSAYSADLFELAQKAVRAQNWGLAIEYFDRVIMENSDSSKVESALSQSADILSQQFAIVFPWTGSYGMGQYLFEIPEDALSVEERYWRLYNEFNESQKTRYQLAKIQQSKGDIDTALWLYEEYLDNIHSWEGEQIDVAYQLIDIYLIKDEITKAAQILEIEQVKVSRYDPVEKQMKLGDLLKAQGQFALAKEAYEKVIDSYVYRENSSFDRMRGGQYQQRINEKIAALNYGPMTEPNVIGNVTKDGEPLTGLKIYVWNKTPTDGYTLPPHLSSFDDLERLYQSVTTDANGQFSFTLTPGQEYEIGVYYNLEMASRLKNHFLTQVNTSFTLGENETKAVELQYIRCSNVELSQDSDGKPAIRWNPVKGASYYSVNIDIIIPSGFSFYKKSGETLYTTKTEINIEDIPSTPLNALPYYQGFPDPSVLIGDVLTSDEHTISVSAYDENDNLLSTNKGLFDTLSSVQYDRRVNINVELSKADQDIVNLIRKSNYRKAIPALEKRLKKNPNDTFALRTLALYLEAGTYNVGQPIKINNDLPRATELLEQLVSLERSPRNLRDLASVYRATGDPEYIEIYKELNKRNEANFEEYSTLAEYYLWTEDDVQAAFEFLQKAHLSGPSSYRLVGYYMMTGQAEKALQIVENILRNRNVTDSISDSLKSYIESHWYQSRKDDFLPVDSTSFATKRSTWEESDDPHQQFLLLFTELCSTDVFAQRAFYKAKIDEFKEKYHTAPELIALLEGISKQIHL